MLHEKHVLLDNNAVDLPKTTKHFSYQYSLKRLCKFTYQHVFTYTIVTLIQVIVSIKYSVINENRTSLFPAITLVLCSGINRTWSTDSETTEKTKINKPTFPRLQCNESSYNCKLSMFILQIRQ